MPDAWEDQIPFYVAGTLTKTEATRLERHFASCGECRRSLDEWQRIATAVRAEAASQLRGLPPLAPRVIATANRQAVGRYGSAPSLVRRPSRTATTSLTLMAAVFTVILFGGLLAFMVLNSSLLQQQANENQVALLPSATPTAVPGTPGEVPQIIIIEPSATPITPTFVVPPSATPTLEFLVVTPVQRLPTSRPTSAPLLILPPTVIASPTPEIPIGTGMGGGGGEPADTVPFSLMQAATCTAHVALSNGVVDLYTNADYTSPVLASLTQADELTVLASRTDGWLQVSLISTSGSKSLLGWVRLEQVYLSGNCDSSPLIGASPTNTPSATATVLPFPTFSPTPVAITSGRWTETRTVTTNGCAVSDADPITQLPVSLTANGSTINVIYGTNGTVLTLARMSDGSFSGSTGVSQGILTLTLAFKTPSSYSGEEVVTHTDGCVVRASVSGVSG